jgi:tyrosyl-tRNA synthetase
MTVLSELTLALTSKFAVLECSALSSSSGQLKQSQARELQQQKVHDSAGKKSAVEGPASKEKNNSSDRSKDKGSGKEKSEPSAANQPAPAAAPDALAAWTDELEQDYQRLVSVGEECITPSELKTLLLSKGRHKRVGNDDDDSDAYVGGGGGGFRLYDGFEPSGRMHIAQGVFKAMNVNKCTYDGTNATFVFWVADWFALMNDKMGGDLEKIQVVGHYLQEVWKAAGMSLDNVQFKWASDEITHRAAEYWPQMLDVARRFNVTRIKKCCQIMGRLENSLSAAQVLYPLMQCTDVFFLKADICQLGVDQRKVNMLAREYCDAAGRKHKPIILSHHMLYGLKAGQEKMSKSDPDSAIFMEDAPEDVARKIQNAYCPSAPVVENDDNAAAADATSANAPELDDDELQDAGKASMQLVKDSLKNPCLDYIQHIIFSPPGATFVAGGATYTDFETVKSEFLSGAIPEGELKAGLIDALNRLLEPVRNHFTTNERAKDLLAKVQQYKKEAAQAPASSQKTIRRLNLVELRVVPSGCHMIVAPLPSLTPSLQTAVDLLDLLSRAPAGAPKVLLLSDWSAVVCNACQADPKAIRNSYQVLLTAIRALDSAESNPVMKDATVVWQSEAILKDPSNYWISVINVGRHFKLDDVMGDTLVDSDGVGMVIARLMMVGDVAGVEPASLSLLDRDGGAAVAQKMVAEFYSHQLPGMAAPAVAVPAPPSIRLQPARETQALVTDNDEYFVLDDPKVRSLMPMLALGRCIGSLIEILKTNVVCCSNMARPS